LLVGCAEEGEGGFDVASDEMDVEASLLFDVVEELLTVVCLTDGFCGDDEDGLGIVVPGKVLVLTQGGDGSISFFGGDVACGGDAFANTDEFKLIFDDVEITWLAASYDDVYGVAADVNGSAHGQLLLLHG